MDAEVSIRGAPAVHHANMQPAGAEAVRSAPAEKAPAPAVPQKPKVSAPKPNEIKFDPAEANKNLEQAVALLNDQLAVKNQGLGFSYDKSVKSPVIKVSNLHTGEVVRQIPSEEVLRIAHKLDDLRGILYNQKS
jgi:flagellar protein FlaG